MGQVVCSTEHTHEFALYLVNASMTNNDEEASKCSLICNHGYRSACTFVALTHLCQPDRRRPRSMTTGKMTTRNVRASHRAIVAALSP